MQIEHRGCADGNEFVTVRKHRRSRKMILKFTELKVKFLINVHAPHMGTTTRNMEVTEEICRKLNNIDKYLKGKNLIHLGDFNANVEKSVGNSLCIRIHEELQLISQQPSIASQSSCQHSCHPGWKLGGF